MVVGPKRWNHLCALNLSKLEVARHVPQIEPSAEGSCHCPCAQQLLSVVRSSKRALCVVNFISVEMKTQEGAITPAWHTTRGYRASDQNTILCSFFPLRCQLL